MESRRDLTLASAINRSRGRHFLPKLRVMTADDLQSLVRLAVQWGYLARECGLAKEMALEKSKELTP